MKQMKSTKEFEAKKCEAKEIVRMNFETKKLEELRACLVNYCLA